MPAQTGCHATRHVWHVTSDGERLNTGHLSHGQRCACGLRVIANIKCDAGCRHKRVVSKAEFDELMEER
jgi:hypothetical protein